MDLAIMDLAIMDLAIMDLAIMDLEIMDLRRSAKRSENLFVAMSMVEAIQSVRGATS